MKVRVKVKSFINEALYEEGSIIEVDALDGRVELVDDEDSEVEGKKRSRKPRE